MKRKLTAAAIAALGWSGCSESSGPIPPDNVECANNASSQQAGEISLSVNQTCLLVGSDATEFILPAAAGAREYMLWVQSSSRTAGSTTQLAISTRQGPAASTAAAPRSTGVSRPADVASEAPPAPHARWLGEERLRQAIRSELARRRARVARSSERSLRASRARAAPPVVGEPVQFLTAVQPDLTVDCSQGMPISARVSAVGRHFAVAEDTRNPTAFTGAELSNLLTLLDDVVFPVDSIHFGSTADLDGNERVWVLFSVTVNELSQAGGATFVAGFFNPTDLADPATCAATNQGEILYLVAPDPQGTSGPPVSRSFAVSNAGSVGAHELQHLISAQQRVVLGNGQLFGDLEDAWLSEGMAHTAETLVGFEVQGLDLGQNLTYAVLAGDPSTFNAYHLENFRRAAQYMRNPANSPVLGTPSGGDPAGLGSIEMRGFSWLFLRWIADRFGAGSAAQRALLRDLTAGGPGVATGISNVERAVEAAGGSGVWRELLSGFGGALPLDDRPGADFPLHTFTTFDLPDIFLGLNRSLNSGVFSSFHPLVVTDLPASGAEVQFVLTASGSSFLRVHSVSVAPATTVRLHTPSGGTLSGVSRLQVGIARVR